LDNNAKEILERSGRLFSTKADLDSLCQELAENFYPERADFTTPLELGDEFASHLFDSFPVLARRELGDAQAAMLRPRDKQWFLHTVDDEEIANNTESQRFLEYTTKVHRRALYDRRAKFVRSTKRADHDYVSFGNAILMLDELPTKDGMSWSVFHFRDCAWMENYEGKVDLIYRKAKVTARKLKQRFTEAKLHQDIKTACEKEPDREFKIIHCVMPAEDYDYIGKKTNSKRLPFVSIFVDVDHAEIIAHEPLDSFRYVVPRWETFGMSPYGFSPAAMVSLPDARQIQSMARVLIEAGEKRVDPPLIATEETLKSEINLYSGGVTYIDREYDEKLGAAIRPLDLGKDVGLGLEMVMRTQSLIAKAWFTNKLGLPEQGDKTAYETSILYEQFIREITPLFEPSEQDYNGGLLDESFGFLMRRGAFGSVDDIPEPLRGKEIIYQFNNPLQDSIERAKVHTYMANLEIVGKASLIYKSAPDHFNNDAALPDAIKGSGSPSKWVHSEDEVGENRAAREEQESAAQALAEGQAAGESIGSLAEASKSVTEAMNPQMAA
jgi:hypothetical protein